MKFMYYDFLLVLFGGFLSYLATHLLEKQKYKKEREDTKLNYELQVKLGLQSFGSSLEKLKSGYSYKNIFEFQKIDLLDSQISDLQTLKGGVGNLSKNRQEKLLALISDITALIRDIRGVETFCFSEDTGTVKSVFQSKEQHDDYFEKQRMQKLIDLVEIKRRIEDFLRELQ